MKDLKSGLDETVRRCGKHKFIDAYNREAGRDYDRECAACAVEPLRQRIRDLEAQLAEATQKNEVV